MDLIKHTHANRYNLFHTLLADLENLYFRVNTSSEASNSISRYQPLLLCFSPESDTCPVSISAQPWIWRQMRNCHKLNTAYEAVYKMITHPNFLSHHHMYTPAVHIMSWFSLIQKPMTCTLKDEEVHTVLEKIKSSCKMPLFDHLDAHSSLFHLHHVLPINDKQLTAKWVHTFYPEAKEFEVDIAQHIIATHPDFTEEECQQHLLQWKEQGLYYPFMLASKYSLSKNDWIDMSHDDVPCPQADALAGLFCNTLHYYDLNNLKKLVTYWNKSKETPMCHHLATQLDNLAIAMRVKSDGIHCKFDLQNSLSSFPFFDTDIEKTPPHQSAFRIWHSMKRSMIQTLPPSIFLQSNTMQSKNVTWGYKHMCLRLDMSNPQKPILFFQPQNMEWLSTPACKTNRVHPMLASKIQKNLCALGEKLGHLDFSRCIVHPLLSMRAFNQEENKQPPLNIHEIDQHIENYHFSNSLVTEMTHENIPLCCMYEEYWNHVMQSVPKSHMIQLPQPLQLLLWRLDIPQRAIVTLDTHKIPPHLRDKVLLTHKNSVSDSTMSQVLTLSSPMDIHSDIPVVLSKFATENLNEQPFFYHAKKEQQRILNTNFVEALHSYVFDPLPEDKVTVVPYTNETPQWTEKSDKIDTRYAELQVHPESGEVHRYRDWLALHMDKGKPLQSRLAMHQVKLTTVHSIHLPWVFPDHTIPVRVLSSDPVDFQILHGETLKNILDDHFLSKQASIRNKRNTDYYTVHHTELHCVYSTCKESEDEKTTPQTHWIALQCLLYDKNIEKIQ